MDMEKDTGEEMKDEGFDSLTYYDDLIGYLRPLEDLFLLMSRIDQKQEKMVYSCSEIGLVLTARFRKRLEEMLEMKRH